MSWLRNLQGQLTDLANEVLSEATEEVQDPESELQVARKKCQEAEEALAVEQSKVAGLESKVKELGEQLYATHVEIDAVAAKYGNMVQARDEEIKRYKIELEQLRASSWNEDGGDNEVLEQQIADLKREVAHWKNLVNASDKSTISKVELDKRLEEARLRKENEVAALVEQHSQSIEELKEMYEEKLAALQGAASSTTSNADLLDAVLLEKEELLDAKKRLEDMVKRKSIDEKPVLLDMTDERTESSSSEGSGHEREEKDREDRERAEREAALRAELDEAKETLKEKAKEAEDLRIQNEELTLAYNDLNEEFEDFKERNLRTVNRNAELSQRIDGLKNAVIEYEERFEISKRENQETNRQLEKLSSSYETLNAAMDQARTLHVEAERYYKTEFQRMSANVEESKKERELMYAEVQKFRNTVGSIDAELNGLRDCNKRLIEENDRMANTIRELTQRSANDESLTPEEEEVNLEMNNLNEARRQEAECKTNLIASLQNEIEALNANNQMHVKQAELLQTMNSQLLEKEEQVSRRMDLLNDKIEILESYNKELLDEQQKLKDELEKQTKIAISETNVTRAAIREELRVKHMYAASGEDWGEATLQKAIDDVMSVDPEGSLLAQLTEALDANTEKTEECERLRQNNEDLEKEISVRQTCIDELISQTNLLQVQQQHTADQMNEMKANFAEKQQKFYETEKQLIHLQNSTSEANLQQNKVEQERLLQIAALQEKIALMEGTVAANRQMASNDDDELRAAMNAAAEERDKARDALREEREKVEERNQQLEELKSTIDQQNQQLIELRSTIDQQEKNLVEAAQAKESTPTETSSAVFEREELGQRISMLEGTNAQLQELVTQKHAECVGYYEKLGETINQLTACQNSLKASEQKTAEVVHQLMSERDQNEKRMRELSRLKEHLMLVEETSTKEAMESEARETQLRALVHELQQTSHAATEGASESIQNYQSRIVNMEARASAAEHAVDEWRSKFLAEEKARAMVTEALTSLQGVVRELSTDHDRETAAASHRNGQLQNEIQKLNTLIAELRADQERTGLDKQAAEDTVESLKETLQNRQRIIEDLEVQLEEARAPAAAAKKDSYRVDDATLRQLFLSYFMATPDRRPDIAILLASILEYPQEDIEKIRQAVRPGAAAGSSGAGRQHTGMSLSEQFIRFLENESESARTAPQLPLPPSTPSAIKQESPVPRPSQSSSGLHSLIQ